jgi:hypothetical protein
MGFLLGKASDTLQEFDTSNQSVQFDEFINTERSIDKSASGYTFKEKGSFDYEFQYLESTPFQNLLELIKNRNSLKEGMILIPIPYSEYSNKCVLLPTYNTTNKVWLGSAQATWYPWNLAFADIPKSEIAESAYDNIRANDSNYVDILPESSNGGVPYFLLQFDLSDFISEFTYKELRRLTVSVLGMNSSPVKFFVWSPTRLDWFLMDDRFHYDETAFTDSAFYLNKSLISSFSLPNGSDSMYADFVDSSDKTVKFMIAGADLNQALLIQYLRLFINGYWVMQDGTQNIENFSEKFTGAGRSGTLSLIEM